MNTQALTRNGWSIWHAALALVLMALGVFATLPAWRDIVRIAGKDEEASHVLLVPIVIAWLIWVRRGRIRDLKPESLWIGPVIGVLGWFVHSFGDFQSHQVLWHGGALLVVIGCLVTVLGADAIRKFLPAFFVLAFLLPVPGSFRMAIAIPLQTATAYVTANVCEILQIPVEHSANQITANGFPVTVVEACNGMRMVFTLILVSIAFSFGTPLRWYVRALVIMLSPISAIVCNVIRLVPNVWVFGEYQNTTVGEVGWLNSLVGSLTDTTKSVGDLFHDVTGWVMPVIAFLILMGMIRLLRWALIPVTQYTLAYDY